MKRLIAKIQKLQAKYGFNSITDLYENCSPIKFIYEDVECEVIEFDADFVNIFSSNDLYLDIEWNEIPKETLEQILEAFEDTILENEKYESIQHYSNI